MSQKLQNPISKDLLRVSTREIDDTISQLQTAFGDGRLDEKEFDDRMKKVLNAKTRGELAELTKDLTLAPQGKLPQIMHLGQSATAIFSGIEQKGPLLLPKNFRITAVMGGIVLDLSDAKLESNICHIHITAIMGGIQIIIPDGIRVLLSGTPILAGFSQKVLTTNFPADAPVIHIHGLAIMSGVEIIAKK